MAPSKCLVASLCAQSSNRKDSFNENHSFLFDSPVDHSAATICNQTNHNQNDCHGHAAHTLIGTHTQGHNNSSKSCGETNLFLRTIWLSPGTSGTRVPVQHQGRDFCFIRAHKKGSTASQNLSLVQLHVRADCEWDLGLVLSGMTASSSKEALRSIDVNGI